MRKLSTREVKWLPYGHWIQNWNCLTLHPSSFHSSKPPTLDNGNVPRETLAPFVKKPTHVSPKSREAEWGSGSGCICSNLPFCVGRWESPRYCCSSHALSLVDWLRCAGLAAQPTLQLAAWEAGVTLAGSSSPLWVLFQSFFPSFPSCPFSFLNCVSSKRQILTSDIDTETINNSFK